MTPDGEKNANRASVMMARWAWREEAWRDSSKIRGDKAA